MLKKHAYNILWILIAANFLLIPVADIRPFQNIPLYPLDYLLALMIGIGLWSFWFLIPKVEKPTFLKISSLFGLLLTSTALSFLANEPTATGLGQIKSWILLPGFAGLLTAFVLQSYLGRNENILRCWLLGLLALLGTVLPYIFTASLTFDGRLQGSFTSPNFLAFFIFPGVLLSFYFWLAAAKQNTKIVFSAAGLLFLFILFLTHSFGGWFALGGSVAWYFLRSKEYKGDVKKIALVLLVFLIFIGAEVATNEKLQGIFEERSSLSSRLTIWTVAGQALREQPLVGIGMGNFQSVYLAYQSQFPPYLEWAVPQPHNIFLALWLQLGFIGLAVMAWFVQNVLRTKEHSRGHRLLQALFIGMLIYGIFDTPLFGNALGFIWWLVLGLLLFPAKK